MSNLGGETLLTLINNVLDYSKLEAGKMDLESSGFDLLRTVEDCGRLVAVKAHEKGLEVVVVVDSDVPQSLARRRRAPAPGAQQPPQQCDQVHTER